MTKKNRGWRDFSDLVVVLVVLHVGDGLKADDRSHDGDDQHHHERQVVAEHPFDRQRPLQHEKLQIAREQELQDREGDDHQVFVLEAVIEDDQKQDDIRRLDERVQIQPEEGFSRQSKWAPAASATGRSR